MYRYTEYFGSFTETIYRRPVGVKNRFVAPAPRLIGTTTFCEEIFFFFFSEPESTR